MIMPNGPAAYVGLAPRARAGVHAPMSACASGAEALAWAWRLLQVGAADVVVAGGAESFINPLVMAGFVRARSMSTKTFAAQEASRPFDVDLNGFVLGEGAGLMVLERAGSAAARGARVYARFTSVGMSNDAYHITAPDPDHTGQSSAVTDALRSAGLSRRTATTSTPMRPPPSSATIRWSPRPRADSAT